MPRKKLPSPLDRGVLHFRVVEELPDGFIPGYEICAGAGISRKALVTWLRQRRYTRPTQAVVVKGGGRTRYVAVALHIAQEYEELWGRPRRPERPKGWLNYKRAVDHVGSETYFRMMARDGVIRSVKVGRCSYYDPAGVEIARRQYRSAFPLPGWVSSRELEREHGYQKGAVRKWLERLRDRRGGEYVDDHTRTYLNPSTKRWETFISPALVEEWKDRRTT